MWMVAAIISGLTPQVRWLGLMVGSYLAVYVHQMNQVNSRNGSEPK